MLNRLVRLQRAPTYNEQFLLHLFTRCKRDPVYCVLMSERQRVLKMMNKVL